MPGNMDEYSNDKNNEYNRDLSDLIKALNEEKQIAQDIASIERVSNEDRKKALDEARKFLLYEGKTLSESDKKRLANQAVLEDLKKKANKISDKEEKEKAQKKIKDLETYFKKQEELEKKKEELALKLQTNKEKKLKEWREKNPEKAIEADYAEKRKEKGKKAFDTVFSGDTGIKDKLSAMKDMNLDDLVSGIADLAKALDNQIDEIASYKSKVNTRLYGLGEEFQWEGKNGLNRSITGLVGVSPFVKQEEVNKNLINMIGSGIAYNIEQRAFLQTLKEDIATTFDAMDTTLLSIVRVQQSDSTAARLGMEANLNAYLNSMYQNTEYLNNLSDSVTGSLYEATSLMSSTESIGFEMQVQKWLGSLYSVGMSQETISGIAGALGQLGSGNVTGLSNNSYGNLLVMSASRAGLDYSELLTQGLNESDTNLLLKSMVEYLSEIASSNKVVQSQYASAFGVKTSDIQAVGNLSSSISNIYKAYSDYNYAGAVNNLYDMADTLGQRISLGEMMSNVWENTKYSISSGIASSPAMYGLWKAAGLLEDTVGGIALPDIKYLGSGVNLQTTVADLMRVTSLSGGILNSIGAMISAGSGGGFSGSKMLQSLGISNSKVSVLSRGTGLTTSGGGATTSMSTTVGASGGDVYDNTMAGVEDEQESKMAEAKNNSNEVTLDIIDNHLTTIDGHLVEMAETTTRIKEIFEMITDGTSVRTASTNYNLTPGV